MCGECVGDDEVCVVRCCKVDAARGLIPFMLEALLYRANRVLYRDVCVAGAKLKWKDYL